jgi:uncharacterized metal-binding protein YceD (DUF177 family)
MSLVVNLRHLAARNILLRGELPVSELDLDARDELIQPGLPLWHDLDVQKLEHSLLVRGQLRLALRCQCARCLKPFEHRVELKEWTCHVALQGEDRAPVINDCVDLTPYIREDILLEFPQHPLCEPDCRGLEKPQIDKATSSGAGQTKSGSSAWAKLDKLKF